MDEELKKEQYMRGKIQDSSNHQDTIALRATQRVPGMYGGVSEGKIKHNPFVKSLGVLCVLVVRLFFYLLKVAPAFFL
ncbi:MAG TPA: hypothetical protein VGL27_04600 [Negativicutes bacterium]